MSLLPSSTRLRRAVAVVTAAAAALTFSSCKTATTKKGAANYSINYDPPAYRPQNQANVRVKISTGKQRLYVTEGNRVLLATPCSVGTASAPTPAGNHRVRAKTFKRRSYSYGKYPMPYWVEFYSGAYGIHWGFIKPYPCTHGCVRLPKMAAPKFFNLVQVGTPINVSSSQPEDATIGAKLPVLDDSALPNPPNSYMMTDAVFQDAVYKGKLFRD